MSLAPTPEAFLEAVGREGALLGLDPGSRTIGIAVCDERRSLASPLETVIRRKLQRDLDALRAISEARAAVGLVIGMPLNMDGSAGRRAQSVRAFSRDVERALALPVLYWDERLSTATAREAMRVAGLRRDVREARVDAMAAAEILRGAIDHLAQLGGGA